MRRMKHVALLSLLMLVAAPSFADEDKALEKDLEPNVFGRVVDELGVPVQGANVHLSQYWVGGSDVTDSWGRFAVTAAPNMEVPLLIRQNGYVEHESNVTAGTKGLRIVLKRGALIRGKLVPPKGAKLPAKMRMTFYDRWERTMVAPLDEDGSFAISGFSRIDEEQQATLYAEGFSAVHFPLTLSKASLKTAQDLGTHQLVWARPVLIRVLDHAGAPIPKADVSIYSMKTQSLRWGMKTDAKGLAYFPRTTNEGLIVHGHLPNRSVRHQGLRIPAGTKTAKHTIELVPFVQLRGTLVWTGGEQAPWKATEAAVDVTISAFKDGKRVDTWFGRTFGQGSAQFAVERGHHGDFELRFSVALRSAWASEPMKVSVPTEALVSGQHELGTVEVGPR